MGVMTSIILGTMIAGSVMRARAAKKKGDEDARVGELNAREADLQATDSAQRGLEEQNMFRRDVRGKLGTQKAGYASQGIALDSGTPGDMAASGEQLLQSDLHRIQFNAQREAMGYGREAEEYRRGARTAKSESKWNVAGAILGGAADVSMVASRMNWGKKTKTTTTKEGG